ncbi:hypothetical protein BCR39DRAFT_556801 [Naematelia encephala]|uniref:Uncharacterized protein n=1 Tax=Naematelia encephala TaxID=71784 RepID=A0A1Y2BGS4_9TREE|nr:hypothetical protein BCR39DRAFT_556801 [Naematelia encephala]
MKSVENPNLLDKPLDQSIHDIQPTQRATELSQAPTEPTAPAQKPTNLPRPFLSPELAPAHLWPTIAKMWAFVEMYPTIHAPQAPLAATSHPRGYKKVENNGRGSSYPAFLYRTKGKKGACEGIGYTINRDSPLEPVEPPKRAQRKRKVREGDEVDFNELESEEDDSGTVNRDGKRQREFSTPDHQIGFKSTHSPESSSESRIVTPDSSSTSSACANQVFSSRIARLERDNTSLEKQLQMQALRYEATIEGIKAEWELERARWKVASGKYV